MKTLGGYRPPTNTTTQRSTSCFLCLCNRRSSRPVHNKLARLQSGVDSRVERQVLGLSIPMAPRSRKTRTDGTLSSSVLLRCYVAIKPQISRACATPGSTVDTLAQKTEMCQKSNARARKTTLSQSHCNADYESAPSARGLRARRSWRSDGDRHGITGRSVQGDRYRDSSTQRRILRQNKHDVP